MKKVIFTESQIKKILGEGVYTGYLSQENNASEVPSNADEIQVTVSDFNSYDKDRTSTPTTDKEAKERNTGRPFANTKMHTFAEGIKKKELFEVNQDFANRKFTVGLNSDTKNDFASSQGEQHSEMIRNIAKGNQTGNSISKTKSRLKQLKKDDPAQYSRLNGKEAERVLDNTLKREKMSSKVKKQVIKNGGNHSVGNSSKKQNINPVSFTYEA